MSMESRLLISSSLLSLIHTLDHKPQINTSIHLVGQSELATCGRSVDEQAVTRGGASSIACIDALIFLTEGHGLCTRSL